eukprot:PLAT7044.7.p1 GENE.PLAT7044.7~~PLAT7044.7.p1  ORF type:complete len:911 (+),score=313.81 PLAT7044.7:176-2908(+)
MGKQPLNDKAGRRRRAAVVLRAIPTAAGAHLTSLAALRTPEPVDLLAGVAEFLGMAGKDKDIGSEVEAKRAAADRERLSKLHKNVAELNSQFESFLLEREGELEAVWARWQALRAALRSDKRVGVWHGETERLKQAAQRVAFYEDVSIAAARLVDRGGSILDSGDSEGRTDDLFADELRSGRSRAAALISSINASGRERERSKLTSFFERQQARSAADRSELLDLLSERDRAHKEHSKYDHTLKLALHELHERLSQTTAKTESVMSDIRVARNTSAALQTAAEMERAKQAEAAAAAAAAAAEELRAVESGTQTDESGESLKELKEELARSRFALIMAETNHLKEMRQLKEELRRSDASVATLSSRSMDAKRQEAELAALRQRADQLHLQLTLKETALEEATARMRELEAKPVVHYALSPRLAPLYPPGTPPAIIALSGHVPSPAVPTPPPAPAKDMSAAAAAAAGTAGAPGVAGAAGELPGSAVDAEVEAGHGTEHSAAGASFPFAPPPTLSMISEGSSDAGSSVEEAAEAVEEAGKPTRSVLPTLGPAEMVQLVEDLRARGRSFGPVVLPGASTMSAVAGALDGLAMPSPPPALRRSSLRRRLSRRSMRGSKSAPMLVEEAADSGSRDEREEEQRRKRAAAGSPPSPWSAAAGDEEGRDGGGGHVLLPVEEAEEDATAAGAPVAAAAGSDAASSHGSSKKDEDGTAAEHGPTAAAADRTKAASLSIAAAATVAVAAAAAARPARSPGLSNHSVMMKHVLRELKGRTEQTRQLQQLLHAERRERQRLQQQLKHERRMHCRLQPTARRMNIGRFIASPVPTRLASPLAHRVRAAGLASSGASGGVASAAHVPEHVPPAPRSPPKASVPAARLRRYRKAARPQSASPSFRSLPIDSRARRRPAIVLRSHGLS